MDHKTKTSRSLLMTCISILLVCGSVQAKTKAALTIEDRQDQLMSNINESQKSGELTTKEARNLRSDLADMAHKKAKLKMKNGKLSEENKKQFEADLNKISVEINKRKLAKRVHPEEKSKSSSK